MALVVYTGNANGDFDESESSSEKGRYVGLSNQGATCYLNSLLQTLFMTPEFRRAIFSWNYDQDQTKDGADIALALQRLFGSLQLSKTRAVDTVELTKSFGWHGGEVYQQQDVQELTRVLFDALETVFKGTGLEKAIDDLYAGELVDYIRCIDVDYKSERKDKFLDLSFAIIPFGSTIAMHSLSECIESFLRPELLSGDNQYFAESGGRKVDAIKGLKFGQLPKIISCNLKRFVYDFSGGDITQKKLNEVVRFPMILDMNKYVASKRVMKNRECPSSICLSEASMQTDGEPGCGGIGDAADPADAADAAEETIPNEEFEEFLRAQMAIVREEAAKANCATGGGRGVGSGPATSDIDMEDPSVPDLVDSEGVTAKDQRAEQDRLNAEHKIWTREEVAALVQERGEWVYELYGVLIHSGAIAGGHYYAYIKDLDTDKWWNFNDSSVTMIDEARVREAWGGSTTTTSLYYGTRTTYTSMSNSNAYMLMYRKVAADAAERVTLPDDSQVPEYIREEVRKQDQKNEERIRRAEEAKNKLELRILWNGQERPVSANKRMTLKEFLSGLWAELSIASSENFTDFQEAQEQTAAAPSAIMEATAAAATTVSPMDDMDTSFDAPVAICEDSFDDTTATAATTTSSSTAAALYVGGNEVSKRGVAGTEVAIVPFERFRLRSLNFQTKVYQNVYDNAGSGSRTLDDLNIYNYTTLALETRSLHDEWEPYSPDSYELPIEYYNADKDCFEKRFVLTMQKEDSGLDLYDRVSAHIDFPRDHLRIVKCKKYGYYDFSAEKVYPNDKVLKGYYSTSSYMITEHEARVYYEEALPDSPAVSDSALLQCYKSFRCQIQIKHNRPPDVSATDYFTIDSRKPVKELRAALADRTGLDVANVRMHKCYVNGVELVDDEQIIQKTGVIENMFIVVSTGKRLPEGHFNIAVYLYECADLVTGIHYLTVPSTSECSSSSGGGSIVVDLTGDDDHAMPPPPPPPTTAPPPYEGDDSLPDSSPHSAGAAVNAVSKIASSLVGNVMATAVHAGKDFAAERATDDWETGDDDAYRSSSSTSMTSLSFPSFSSSTAATAATAAVAAAVHTSTTVCSMSDSVMYIPTATATVTATAVCMSATGEPDFMNADVTDVVAVTVAGVAAVEVEDDDSAVPAFIGIAGGSDGRSCAGTGEHEANDFAMKMAALKEAPENFKLVEDMERTPMAKLSLIEDIRRDIASHLKARGLLPEHATAQHVRIRDRARYVTRVGKIFRDGLTLGYCKNYVADGDQLVVQILDQPEQLPPENHGDMVIPVRRWNRQTWSLSPCREVYIPGTMTVKDIALQLASLFNMPSEQIRVLVVTGYSDAHLCYLDKEAPIEPDSTSTIKWINPFESYSATKQIRDTYLLTSLSTLVIQDLAEPLRELTPADRMSINIYEAAISSAYTSDPYYKNSYVSYPQTKPYSAPAPAGIKITVGKSTSNSSGTAGASSSSSSHNNLVGANAELGDEKSSGASVGRYPADVEGGYGSMDLDGSDSGGRDAALGSEAEANRYALFWDLN